MRFLLVALAFFLQMGVGMRLKRHFERTRHVSPTTGCPLAGLKVEGINSVVKVMHPIPAPGSSPFKDYESDTYTFKNLGDFGMDSDMHYLHAKLTYGTGGHWQIQAAVPLNIYLNFLQVETPGQVPRQFTGGKWRVSGKRGATVSYTGWIGFDNDTYAPDKGVVISRPLAAGRQLQIPMPDAFYGNSSSTGQFLVFVRPVCGDSLLGCPLGGWRVIKKLGEGAQGDIYEVTQIDESGADIAVDLTYALKLPKQNANPEIAAINAKDINTEREIALAASSCANVLDIIDAQPCVLQGSTYMLISSGYVMPKLKADVAKWLNAASPQDKQNCFNGLNDQLNSGISCLHQVAQYVHGDLKSDNAMYEYEDEHNCPRGIQIIDFGKARVVGSYETPNPSNYYVEYSQYPTGMYYEVRNDYPLRPTPNGVVDTLGIMSHDSAGTPLYRVDADIDWCMYRFMMRMYFGLDLAWNDDLDCGMMGPNRAWWMKADGTQEVSGSWPPPQQARLQPSAQPLRARPTGLRHSIAPQHVQEGLRLQAEAKPVANVRRIVFVDQQAVPIAANRGLQQGLQRVGIGVPVHRF